MLVHVPRHHSAPVSGALELVVPHDSLWTPGYVGEFTTRLGTMTLGTTPAGVGARGNTSTYVSKPTNIIGKPWTIIGVFYLRAALSGEWFAGVCEQPGGSGGWDRQIGRNVGSPAVMLYDGANKYARVPAFSLTTEFVYSLVGVCDGRTLRAACNGIPGESTAVSNAGYAAYTSPEFNVGNSSNARFTSEYYTSLVALLPYADQNYVELSANPWQIFKPHRARVYSFPAASGGSDISISQSAVETLSLTEYAGTVGVSIDLTGALETLSLTEYQGVVGVSIALNGALETLALTEYAGTVGVDMAISGALETLTLTEYQGTVSLSQDISLTGNLETLTLTEYAGQVGVSIDLAGALETLTLTEYAGTLTVGSDIELSGNLETLSLTEFQGQTGVAMALAGNLETLTLIEYQGTVSITNDITLSQGSVETLALTEYPGVTGLSMDLTGNLETLTLTEYTGLPGVSIDLTGALETLILTEYQGTTDLAEAIAIVGNLETLALTEFAGTITLDVSLTGVLEMLTLTEYAGVLRLYDPLARVWRIYSTVPDERTLETTVTQATENSFVSDDEPPTIVNGV